MKVDPHNHREIYESWKAEALEHGISRLNGEHSKLLLSYLTDMERGQNIGRGSKKGGRSYIRLNALRVRIGQLLERLELRGVEHVNMLNEEIIHTFFDDMKKGRITRVDGRPYASIRDHVRDFKSFWHWLIKVGKKEGKQLADISEDLDSRKEAHYFVFFTREELEQLLPYFAPDEQVMCLFMFDTIIRAPTELANVKLSDVSLDFSELNIRDETAKTYGRRIKLLLCKDALKHYVQERKLTPDDYLFAFSYPNFTKKLKRVARQVFGEVMTKGGYSFSELSMYDFRHSGACHWRLGAYRSKIDALMYRGGWNNLEMLNYYTKKLGMKDSIEKEDLLIGLDKTQLEKEIDRLKRDNEAVNRSLALHESQAVQRLEQLKEAHEIDSRQSKKLLAILTHIAELGLQHELKQLNDQKYARLLVEVQRELVQAHQASNIASRSATG